MRLRRTIIHLFPSNSFFGGFFVRKLSGFGFLPGAGLVPRPPLPLPAPPLTPKLDELSLRCGTVELCRRLGFLCVICEASTFFNPAVTPSPLFRSANTAPISAGCFDFAEGTGGRLPGGGGGPGGGGMAPEGGGPGGGGGIEDPEGVAVGVAWQRRLAELVGRLEFDEVVSLGPVWCHPPCPSMVWCPSWLLLDFAR